MTFFFYAIIGIVSIIFLMMYSSVAKSTLNHKNSLKIVLLSLSFLSLFIPLILRDVSVGADYVSYMDTFKDIALNDVIDESDITWLGWPFIYLLKLIAPLALNNYVLFYGLISFASLLFLYAAILKRSKMPWLSLALFIGFCLYFQMFNQIRQLFAICIILYSLTHIENKQFIKFTLLIFFASIFHKTALLFLPFYFISRLNINKKTLFIYLVGGVAACFMFPTIIELIALTSYGQIYLPSGYNAAFASSTVINFGIRTTLLIGCLILAAKVLKEAKNKHLYNLVIYCTIIQSLTMFSSLFGRITTMFFVFYILLVPEVINANFKGYGRKLATMLTIILLIIYQYVYYTSPNGAVSGGYETYKIMPS